MSGTFCEELALRVLRTKGTGHLFLAHCLRNRGIGIRAINCEHCVSPALSLTTGLPRGISFQPVSPEHDKLEAYPTAKIPHETMRQNSQPSSPAPLIQGILEAISAGKLTVEQALERLRHDQTIAIDNATVDIGRASRCRFGEVIYGEGKSRALITLIARTQLDHGQNVLVTRLNQVDAAAVCESFEHTFYHPQARTLRIGSSPVPLVVSQLNEQSIKRPVVAVVTAGSTDALVAAEALQTLAWMNVATVEVTDIGVAGPQRLLAAVPLLRQAAVVVVVAGMEGALPSALGGHLPCPIIAVPTSVGYGSCFGGITALLGMLSSCASNVSVVGIDAGFKGGYVAGLIATQLAEGLTLDCVDNNRAKLVGTQ